MTPIQQLVLNKISSGESDSYDKLFGGHRFSSYHDHPGIPIPIPGSRQVSTAAGRYQITRPTWEEQKARLGLPDFSPRSQDLAAWDLAQRTYKQQTGRDLEADAAAGKTNWGALSNQWTSLKGELVAKETAHGPGASSIPSPRLTSLEDNPTALLTSPDSLSLASLQAVTSHKLTPTAGNPFLLSPFMRPVEHDPFAADLELKAPKQ